MSPILGLQQQLRQLGRIRIGNQVVSRNGKMRPAKLETFRLTSPSRSMVEAAAEAYGGRVVPWTNPAGGPEWECITTSAVLDIAIPPGQSVTQWREMWSGGGCVRRCNGEVMVLDMTPCACPRDHEARQALAADGEACRDTTRLTVVLPALPDLGSWMLESHGYYAAVELAGVAEILAMATEAGYLLPARLRLDQRQKKIPGQPTRQYAVPVIELGVRMAELGVGTSFTPRPALAAGVRPGQPQLPATTLPPTSDFRGPAERTTETEPDGQHPTAGGASDPVDEPGGSQLAGSAPTRSVCGSIGAGDVAGEVCAREPDHLGAHKNEDASAIWPRVK